MRQPDTTFVLRNSSHRLKCLIMALWKISAKNNWNWGVGKQLVKGMFIELSTPSTSNPLGQTKYLDVIAKAFNTKYSTNFDKSRMYASFFYISIDK